MVPLGTYCQHCGRSCACLGGNVVYIVIGGAPARTGGGSSLGRLGEGLRRLDERLRKLATSITDLKAGINTMPLFGWYNIFRPADPAPHARSATRTYRHRRPQARACRIDRNRWKRRRFLHALRKAG